MGPWPNDPLGPQARSAADIYWIMFIAAVIVLVIVDGTLVYSGLKFRERPGHVAKQFHGHNFLELVWTVIPTFMVISFSVSNIGGKKDAVPGRATELWIQADKPGTYKGQCFEFCGTGHADMLITLVVHPQSDYATWISDARKEAERATSQETKAGRELFLSQQCAGCHTVKNTPAGGKVGPELTYVASKKSIARGKLSPVNEENLTKWIHDPKATLPDTVMPNLGLSDQQIHDIVSWLLTLKCAQNQPRCP